MGVLETGSSLDIDAEHPSGEKGGWVFFPGGGPDLVLSPFPPFQGHFQPVSHSLLSGFVTG